MRPYPSPRPRATARGGYASVYMPAEYKKHKELVQTYFPKLQLTGPLMVNMEFYFRPPKSWSKKKLAESLNNWHTQKPDKDNLEKTIMDAMNGHVYKDDSQVCVGQTLKKWAIEDKIVVTIAELEV
jgi:Holliday junction resolvase